MSHAYAPTFAPEINRGLALDLASLPGRPKSVSSKRASHVDSKSWPKFDGTGPVEAFILKVDYFMEGSDMDEEERTRKMMELIRGRAFTWLSS